MIEQAGETVQPALIIDMNECKRKLKFELTCTFGRMFATKEVTITNYPRDNCFTPLVNDLCV